MDDKTKNDINAVVTDQQHEAGEFPIGKVVHFSTVTHAFRGVLEAVTPSDYWLKRGTASIIHDTGDVSEYSTAKDSNARESEEVHRAAQIQIPRAAVAWKMVWE